MIETCCYTWKEIMPMRLNLIILLCIPAFLYCHTGTGQKKGK